MGGISEPLSPFLPAQSSTTAGWSGTTAGRNGTTTAPSGTTTQWKSRGLGEGSSSSNDGGSGTTAYKRYYRCYYRFYYHRTRHEKNLSRIDAEVESSRGGTAAYKPKLYYRAFSAVLPLRAYTRYYHPGYGTTAPT